MWRGRSGSPTRRISSRNSAAATECCRLIINEGLVRWRIQADNRGATVLQSVTRVHPSRQIIAGQESFHSFAASAGTSHLSRKPTAPNESPQDRDLARDESEIEL